MTHRFKTRLEQAHARGDYEALLDLIPYAKLIGIECTRQGDELLFRLPANKDNIGNPILPALHGGVIAGFMELSAALHLLEFTGAPGVPKNHRLFPGLPACRPVSRHLRQMPGVAPGPASGECSDHGLAKYVGRTDCHRPGTFQD
jgi:hypothetical protein